MENSEIVSTTTSVQGKKTIGGNSVVFTYNFEQGKAPLAVVFNLQREGSQVSGTYYPTSQKFEVNTTSYQPGDGQLQDEIFGTCKAIVDSMVPVAE